MGLTVKTTPQGAEAKRWKTVQAIEVILEPEKHRDSFKLSNQGHPIERAYNRYLAWERQLALLTKEVNALLDTSTPEAEWVFVEPLRHLLAEWEKEPGSFLYPLETDVNLLKLDDGLMLPLKWNANELGFSHQTQMDVRLLKEDLKHLTTWKRELEGRLSDLAMAWRRVQVQQANEGAVAVEPQPKTVDVATALVTA